MNDNETKKTEKRQMRSSRSKARAGYLRGERHEERHGQQLEFCTSGGVGMAWDQAHSGHELAPSKLATGVTHTHNARELGRNMRAPARESFLTLSRMTAEWFMCRCTSRGVTPKLQIRSLSGCLGDWADSLRLPTHSGSASRSERGRAAARNAPKGELGARRDRF